MTRWVQHLLQWFALHRRPMPWRDDPSPYKVWISETMLQQTRVTAVIPYFERFIVTFPNLQSLADAPIEAVLKAWEGLGYYSRARNLHAAARRIVDQHDGKFPQTEAAWRSLPGVGPYTAAAVASIACGQTAAAVDGNVMRVWSRLRGIRDNVASTAYREKARLDLLRYVRTCDPSLFNQAMMELGALVCLPRNPACADCPLRQTCIAARKGLTDAIPMRQKKAPVPHRNEAALVVVAGHHVLLRQRPQKGLLGGLWEFPSCIIRDSVPPQLAATGLAASLGFPAPMQLLPIGTIEHAFTHFSQTIHVFQLNTDASHHHNYAPEEWQWCSPNKRQNYPLSRTQRRINDLLSR